MTLLVISVKSLTPQQNSDHPTILISGGAGFIGRYIAHEFCTHGWKVTIVDNLSSPHSLSPEDWPYYLECPLGSLQFIKEDCGHYFSRNESYQVWNIFIHLASMTIRSSPTSAYTSESESERGGEKLAYSLQMTGKF